MFLIDQAQIYYAIQQYDLAQITWTDFSNDFCIVFWPSDFVWQSRVQIFKIQIVLADYSDYVARFNIIYDYCIHVCSYKAQFFQAEFTVCSLGIDAGIVANQIAERTKKIVQVALYRTTGNSTSNTSSLTFILSITIFLKKTQAIVRNLEGIIPQ